MAEKKAGSVVIKLDLRGQEELKRRLEELGPTGERVWRDLSRGARPAQQGFQAVDQARKQLQGGIDDLASRAGPLGGFLTSIGPWGVAAAAGLGVLALALREVFMLMERSRETAFWAEELENIERASGLAAESVMSLVSAVELAGGEAAPILAGLEELSKRIGEYRARGEGEARDAFDILGIRDLVDGGADVTTILDTVIDRMREIQDPTQRQVIADKLGLRDAAPLLQQTNEEMDRLLDTAERINASLSGAAIQRFANAASAIREAELRAERAGQLESLATLDLAVQRAEAAARIAEWRASVTLERVDLEERSTEQLQLQEARLIRIAESQRAQLASDSLPAMFRPEVADNLARTEEQLREIQNRLFEMGRMDMASGIDTASALANFRAMVAGWNDPGSSADEVPAERRRELEALLEQSYRATLTPLQQLRQYEADLNQARAAGITIGEENIEITQQLIDQLVALRAEALGLHPKLDQLTDDQRKLAGAIEGTLDPLEQQKQLLEELLRPSTEAADRLERLFALWRESPEHADIIIAEIEAVKEALHGAEGDNVIRVEDRFPGLRKMAEEYENLTTAIDAGGTRILDGIGDGLADIATGAGSVGDAFEDMGERILRVLAEIAIQRMVIGPIAGAFDQALTSWMNNSGAGSGTGTTPLPKHDTGASYTFKGNPGVDQNVLALNGQPFAQVSRNEDLHIIPALKTMGPMGGASRAAGAETLEIVLKDEREGGKSRIADRRSADGTRRMEIMLAEVIKGQFGSGEFDDVFERRFGLEPRPGRR